MNKGDNVIGFFKNKFIKEKNIVPNLSQIDFNHGIFATILK